MKCEIRKAAKENGSARFYTGVACSNGHICERYVVNNRCCECQLDSLKANRKSNPDRTKELAKIHARIGYAKNRLHILERQKQINAENPERAKKNRKTHYENNKEKRISYNAVYTAKNPDKCKLWADRYNAKKPEVKRNNRRKYQARKVNAMPLWADQSAIREFYKQAEILTKQTGIKHHVDHIHPLNGKNFCGLHVEYNLQVIPGNENLKKSNKLIEWALPTREALAWLLP